MTDQSPNIGGLRIHFCGLGRAGTATQDSLLWAGAQYFSANDPQYVDEEALSALPYLQTSDEGTPKVDGRARHLRGFAGVTFDSVAARNEEPSVDPLIQTAAVVVSAANTRDGRLAAAAKALRYRKPLFDLALADARQALGGFLKIWLPENASWSSCPGCWLVEKRDVPRGEVLLGSVAAYVGAVAAQLITQYMLDLDAAVVRENTFFVIDAATHEIQQYRVGKNPECPVCGTQGAESPATSGKDETEPLQTGHHERDCDA